MKEIFVSFVKAISTPKSLVGIFIFLILSVSVHLGYWNHFNLWSIQFVQSFANKPLDYFFAIDSYLGSPEVTGLASLVIAYWLWKKFGLVPAGVLMASLASVTLIEVAGKYLIFHPGPYSFRRLPFGDTKGILLYMETPNTFPSGHTIRTIFVVLLFMRLVLTQRKHQAAWLILCFFVVVPMVINRVYLGEHWISDVVGGLVLAYLGYVWTMASVSFAQRARE